MDIVAKLKHLGRIAQRRQPWEQQDRGQHDTTCKTPCLQSKRYPAQDEILERGDDHNHDGAIHLLKKMAEKLDVDDQMQSINTMDIFAEAAVKPNDSFIFRLFDQAEVIALREKEDMPIARVVAIEYNDDEELEREERFKSVAMTAAQINELSRIQHASIGKRIAWSLREVDPNPLAFIYRCSGAIVLFMYHCLHKRDCCRITVLQNMIMARRIRLLYLKIKATRRLQVLLVTLALVKNKGPD